MKKRDRRDPEGYVIYRHVCRETDKSYIGQTEYTAERRWLQHVRSARRGSELLLHRAIRKYGEESFSHYVLEKTKTRAEANVAEARWIEYFRSDSIGYNLDAGGASHNTHPDTKAKIGAFHRQRLAAMSEAERSDLGRKVSAGLSREDRSRRRLAEWAACSDEERAAHVKRLQGSRSSQERSEATRKVCAARTPEQIAEISRKRLAALTPEQRSAAARKRASTLGEEGLRAVGAKISAAWHLKSPEERMAIVERSRQTLPTAVRSDRFRERLAAMTAEQLSERARRAHAARTAEERSATALAREARKRIARAARATEIEGQR